MKPVLLFIASLLLVSCGGGGGNSADNSAVAPPVAAPGITATGLLVTVETGEALLESIRAGFRRELISSAEEADLAVAPGAPALSDAFSATYTQEASVDEHDVVKYDGRHLYIAPTRGMRCCFLFEPELALVGDADLIPPAPDTSDRVIRILATDPGAARADPVSEIALADELSVEGLYVSGESLAVITSTSWWGHYGVDFSSPRSWAEQATGFLLYDIATPETPEQQWQISVEGGFVTSRRVDDTIYLITRHSPSIEGLVLYPADEATMAQNTSLLDTLTLPDITPRVVVNGQESPLFTATDCLVEDASHDLAPQQRGYPVLTTIIAIDLATPGIAGTLCYSEAASGVYMSPDAIYLTHGDYDPAAGAQTLVHRIDYRDGLKYRGSGKVTGDLLTGSHPDFRISESAGFLRLATTLWTGSQLDFVEHYLHVLQPAEADLELELVATLPNSTRPDPIGKPNEDLYGVRFLGDRAYMVTFERTDPLYVIDLSDHADPRIAGELEVTGFSDFLHPVTDELLLGLGADQFGRVKLELFDISSLSEPASLGALVLSPDANWTYSEARYDRHAFTYLAGRPGTDRLTLPVTAEFFSEESGYTSRQRLHLLEIRGTAEAATAAMVEIGYIATTPAPEYSYGGTQSRAIIHDDAVYFVSGESVWSAFWTNPAAATGPH
jgi:uncharacterized secreted protein with C-terminal beta-propeller domain